MENPEKDHFNDQMRERTMNLAIGVHQLFKEKKIPMILRPVVNQLIRSSSSVASNHSAATRARSDAEFYAKICIVVEECDETQFWLEYLRRTGLVSRSEIIEIQNEAEQLVRIFSATKKKMQEKLKSVQMRNAKCKM